MLRAPRGWALDAAVLDQLRALRVTTIVVTDAETGTVYSAPLNEFSTHGVAFERGFGLQLALPLDYWSIDGQPPQRARGQPAAGQLSFLSLFEGVE